MTTIYVSPGENTQAAADELKAGDSIMLRTGHHYGQIVVPVDEVTILGEPGAILEGTQPLDTDAWEEASDTDGITSLAGTGTWRVPLAGWAWQLLEPGGNSILRLDSDYVGVKEPNNYYMTAYGALAVPNNAKPGADYGADWWEGIEALWVYNTWNRYLYVRYRDGRKPDQLRWSGGHSDHREPPSAEGSVIYLKGRRDIIVAELQIRGCVDGVAIRDSSRVEVVGCEFQGFDFATRVYGVSEQVAVTGCKFNSKLLGTEAVKPVSKLSTEVPEPWSRYIAYHVYSIHKFFHDESDSTHVSALSIYNSWDDATQTVGVPRQIEFAHNQVECCVFGVDCFGGDGIELHHNQISNMIDMPFQRSDGGRNISIHDNETHEAGYCLIRWHKPEQEAGKNYIFNNRSSDQVLVSDFLFMSCYVQGGAASNLILWVYHNSFSGGNASLTIANITTMPGFYVLNNAISHSREMAPAIRVQFGEVNPRTGEAPVQGSMQQIGAFDYNATSSHISGAGEHNQTGMPPIWDDSQIERNFVIPDGHAAKASGIDISKQFEIGGVTYDPLPGFEPGYFQGVAPDRGWINRQGGEMPDQPVLAEITSPVPESTLQGATVTFTWTAGQGVTEYWLDLGTSERGTEIYTATQGLFFSVVVNGIPTTGIPIFVRLWSEIAGEWQFVDYRYTAATNAEPDPEPEPDPGRGWVRVFIPAWIPEADIVQSELSRLRINEGVQEEIVRRRQTPAKRGPHAGKK